MFDEYYNEYNYILYLLKNKINIHKIRMLFSDGGQIVLLCNEHLIYVNSDFDIKFNEIKREIKNVTIILISNVIQ